MHNIGTYASWFAVSSNTSPSKSELLMSAISYVVQSLPDQTLSLQAASALRNLCDANRKALAPQIGAFAELHAGLAQVPVRSRLRHFSCQGITTLFQDSEKSKVMESLASVVEALPPVEAVPTVEVNFT